MALYGLVRACVRVSPWWVFAGSLRGFKGASSVLLRVWLYVCPNGRKWGCMGACVPCLGVVSSDAIKWAVYGSIRACRAGVLGLVSLLWVEWTRLVNCGLADLTSSTVQVCVKY